MKVYIGNYDYHKSVYYLEGKWLSYNHNKRVYDIDEEDYTRVDKIIIGILSVIQWCLNATINKFIDWRGRKINIQIDHYDTWNMDHTLALIIVPMLKQLKETKHGSPNTDLEDVPENLRDSDVHVRWDWIMNEMIWAFEQIISEEELGIMAQEFLKNDERIKNGTMLFGKYYRGLWD